MYRQGSWWKKQGFTLVEMVVAMLVAGLLLSVAVPAFQSFVANGALRTTAQDLIIALNSARSSAVNYSVDVTMAPAAGGWSDGWTVQYPAGFSAEEDQQFVPSGKTSVTSGSAAFTFDRQGFTRTTAVFTVCNPGDQSQGREITVGPTGKISNVKKACP